MSAIDSDSQRTVPFADDFAIADPYLRRFHNEADRMQAVIEVPVDLDNPSTLTERLRVLDVYLARLGDMRVRAKTLKEVARNRFLEKNANELAKMTATVSNRAITSYLIEYTMTADRLESMYDTVSKLAKDIVTQISYIKAQMQMN